LEDALTEQDPAGSLLPAETNPIASVVESPAEQPKTSFWKSVWWETIQTLLLALILYVIIDTFIGRVRVENISMQPTLQPGEFILTNKLIMRLGGLQRGDIVVFHYPNGVTSDYIKRVIGLPGDHVSIRQNRVYVNEQLLHEPYIMAEPATSGEYDVPADQYFMLGDNRNNSSDSRSWGFVSSNLVIGKALVVYWPLDKFKILNSDLTYSQN
jgi:signal peptidase I